MSVSTATQERQIRMLVGGKSFSITLADTRAVRKLMQLLPLTLHLHDYAGFEKVGALGTQLPSDDVWMTARTGDVVLYNSNQIVLMCGPIPGTTRDSATSAIPAIGSKLSATTMSKFS